MRGFDKFKAIFWEQTKYKSPIKKITPGVIKNEGGSVVLGAANAYEIIKTFLYRFYRRITILYTTIFYSFIRVCKKVDFAKTSAFGFK